MQIGIIGKGFVGGALGEVLDKNHDIIYYDKFKESNEVQDLVKCDAIFICVPTPMKISGEVDLSMVEDAIQNCPENIPVIIKSTVVPGTTDRLSKKYNRSIYFNPEFLRQDYAVEDMKNPHKTVVTHPIILDIFKGFPLGEVIHADNKTAEMMKYANNVMLAGQIGIANELYRICSQFEINYDEIKSSMLTDKRIGRNINVPGPDGKTGFGGACFPKDLNALIYHCKQKGYTPHLLEEVWRSND